jgi:CheY-like chemotaxis protein
MNRITSVILIDDDDSTNYLNKAIIGLTHKDTNIEVFNQAAKALEHINDRPSTNKTLIFLDLNMPGMNGWDFISAYKELENKNENNVIVILSSSINPDDKLKSLQIKEITDFRSKPLSPETLAQIEEAYFLN